MCYHALSVNFRSMVLINIHYTIPIYSRSLPGFSRIFHDPQKITQNRTKSCPCSPTPSLASLNAWACRNLGSKRGPASVPFLPLHSGQSGIKKWSHLRYWLWLYKLCKSSTMWIKWKGSNLHYNWITFIKSDILLVASFWRLLWFHSHVSVPSCHSSHSTAPGLKGPADAPAVASCASKAVE